VWLLSFIFIPVVILQFSCLSCYLVSYTCSYTCYCFMHIVYMHELSPLHTHSPGRFLTTLDLHVQILDALFLLCRCSMRPYILRGADLSPFWLWYSCISLFLLLFFNSCISHLASILFFISFKIMCSLYMYYCSDGWLLWFRFITCSGYFRLSAYTWGIFFAYCVADSCRVSAPAYFGKRGVTRV